MRILVLGRVLVLGALSAAVLVSAPPAKQDAGPGKPVAPPVKRRIAVFNFDNAAHPRSSNIFAVMQGPAPDLGKAAADMVITRLVQDGRVTVVERNAIAKLLAEQNLSNSDRTDQQTAAKLGRILGVDAIVLGSVTQYDFLDKTSSTHGRPGFMGFGTSSPKIKQELKAHVQIDARVVSPDTSEVLTVAEGDGVIDRKQKVDFTEISNLEMGKGNLHDSIMSEAMDKAVSQVVAGLEQSLPQIPAHAVVVNGLVADASDLGQLILNVGARNGVKQGDHLQIWRGGKEVRDPATGRVLMREDILLGEAVVHTVRDRFSIAAYQGKPGVKIGDIVKSSAKTE
ncbi:MAG: CsgG/HfaB family protein [Bryobacteraceae bacterium]